MTSSPSGLPTFLGLGVQKGGTSWLHRQMSLHPQIFVPAQRKEIHYFDRYFDRGEEWYRSWFAPASKAPFRAAGEITPEYLYVEQAAPRIKDLLPDAKFIVVLRHPVRRAFSHYCMLFQSGEGQKYKDFDDFMTHHPHGAARGFYAGQITRFFGLFDRAQFLFLVYEDIFNGTDGTEKCFSTLGGFLGVNADLFDRADAQRRVGQARSIPRFAALAQAMQWARQKLRDMDMDALAEQAVQLGMTRQLFASGQNVPPLTQEQIARWLDFYRDDIAVLEQMLGRRFPAWI